jgi:hypothetical protein
MQIPIMTTISTLIIVVAIIRAVSMPPPLSRCGTKVLDKVFAGVADWIETDTTLLGTCGHGLL